MRKNYSYEAVIPATRNEFIDYIKGKSEVIVISHSLLEELDEELKKNQNKGKAKTALKTAGGIGLLVLNLYNPLTWVFGVGSILAGGLLKNEIKEYNAHVGVDVHENDILLLIHKKKVNLKYDSIILDRTYIDSVPDLGIDNDDGDEPDSAYNDSDELKISLSEYLDTISDDATKYAKFCFAYAATLHYFVQCDGTILPEEKRHEKSFLELVLSAEFLPEDTKKRIEELFEQKNVVFFVVRKYLDAISVDDLTIIKREIREKYFTDDDFNDDEEVAFEKFMSYFDERTDKWHKDRAFNPNI